MMVGSVFTSMPCSREKCGADRGNGCACTRPDPEWYAAVCGITGQQLFRDRRIQCGVKGGVDAVDGGAGETMALTGTGVDPAALLQGIIAVCADQPG